MQLQIDCVPVTPVTVFQNCPDYSPSKEANAYRILHLRHMFER